MKTKTGLNVAVIIGLGLSLLYLPFQAQAEEALVVASLPTIRSTESNLKDVRQDIAETLKGVRPGITTRADIEKLLTERDGGPQGISSTRYYSANAGMLIEVPFDQTGGTWTGNNRVSGALLVTARPRHSF